MSACIGSHSAARSVYEEAFVEAERHRWIESEKCGYDRGDRAVREWFDRYFLGFCWHRRLEHLRGDHPFDEFGDRYYGVLIELRILAKRDWVVRWVLDRFYDGQENLEIIDCAHTAGIPVRQVLQVLERLNINEGRLDFGRLVGVGYRISS